MELGENLAVLGVLPRGDYRDVLVTAKGTKVKNQSDFVVGTGSLRRRTNFKKLYNKVSFADIRGNVDTRLRKLLNGEYDGVILAMAGLERLNKLKESDFDFMPFEYNEFLPAPCQGIIAVEGRVDDFTTELINSINDESTFIAFETEREVLKLLNADCGMPVGAYSYLTKGNIVLSVSKTSEKSICSSDSISNRMELAKRLVEKL
jgi:hydroxymethylbilane synthase